jgi:hypothetical protein
MVFKFPTQYNPFTRGRLLGVHLNRVLALENARSIHGLAGICSAKSKGAG